MCSSTLHGNAIKAEVDSEQRSSNGLYAGTYQMTLTVSFRRFCVYIDPNPINKLNNHGHNYFLSQNPYVLNSYAGFGEAYYNLTKDLKLTAGARWTDDQKHFMDIPSEVVDRRATAIPVTGVSSIRAMGLDGPAAPIGPRSSTSPTRP